MNILITGSEGYLGSHLVEFFQKKNFKVYGCDIYKNSIIDNYTYYNLDISNIKNFHMIDNIKFDLIIHCAAKLAFEKNKNKILKSNIDGTKNILEFISFNNKSAKLIFISTASIFCSNYKNRVKEDDKINIIDTYGYSKYESEKIIISSKVNFVIIRCPIILSHKRSGVLGIVYDLISKNKKIPLLNKGSNIFDVIDINDLTEAIYITSNRANNELYNIGCDQELTFHKVFDFIIKKSNSKSNFLYLPKFNLGILFKILFYFKLSPLSSYHLTMLVNNFRFDNKKLKKLGWVPKKNIFEVFYESYDHYIKNNINDSRSKNTIKHKLGIIKLLHLIL